MLKTFGNLLLEGLYFDTVKLVTVRHLKLSLLHRAVQFGILCYIVVFVCLLSPWGLFLTLRRFIGSEGTRLLLLFMELSSRRYGPCDVLYHSLIFQVKGVTRVGNITYDSSDLVIPPTENGAIFITTRKFTYRQHRGILCCFVISFFWTAFFAIRLTCRRVF
jgi:hypothetical protein